VAGELDAFEADGVEPAGEPLAQLGGAHRIAEARKIDDVSATPGPQQLEYRRPPPP
jgi:hypothetical protein